VEPDWEPKPGDAIKYTIQHFGIVKEVLGSGQYAVLDGNWNRCVQSRYVSREEISYFMDLEPFLLEEMARRSEEPEPSWGE